ncbi:MAG: oxygen-independent coproporphyrinogen III oxidase [Candidatus Latescibacteria bacterium]|jgi:oxygen-independent coproporphyrinogen-3 oxidase|nr:oxygen-independent coproporphyrinogen III oxidase [Candidatus Latescibacterota bacterium]
MRNIHIDADLLRRYDQPGPRYTSYPTAVEFHEGFTASDYANRLSVFGGKQCISLYIHLPFCEHRCSFCGCNVVVTRKREVAARYLSYLEREMALVREHLQGKPTVLQYHWGGGTPTYFTPEQLGRLHETVQKYFHILPDAERAVEVDPKVTTKEHIDLLADLGFNRLSMGIQDFTPAVQAAIQRNQDETATRELYEYCRERGFTAINFDLIYGLPEQTHAGFERNLASVLMMRPDRVALYSYAHVPWAKGHQKRIDTSRLPAAETKFELFARAIRAFQTSGYRQIGMDHFALPEDELSCALEHRRLRRNFMGYTVHRTPNLIGLGLSAIGEVCGSYVQNAKKLSAYYRALDEGKLPVERGYILDRDDRIRRQVVTALMCNGYLHLGEIERCYGVRFREYFVRELEALARGPVEDGLLEIEDDALVATPVGKLFIRNICMVFDSYLERKKEDSAVFSRTI